MSLFYQTRALLVCGICPDCRHRSLDCEHVVVETMFGSEERHEYECGQCGAETQLFEYEPSLAYRNTQHWDEMPTYESDT